MKARTAELLASGSKVCLWLSGGKDSLLLLEVMLEQKQPFWILRFDDGWDRAQRRQVDEVIRRHGLQVFSYPPAKTFLVEKDSEISLVTAYAIDRAGRTAGIVRDCVDDPKRCAFDVALERPKTSQAPIEFDIHVWGSRGDDRHWIRGPEPVIATETWTIGEKTFTAPLYDWSGDEVLEALKTYGSYELQHDTGDIACCTRCLTATADVLCPKTGTMIPPVEWDRQANLKMLDQF